MNKNKTGDDVWFMEQSKAFKACQSLLMINFDDLRLANLCWLNKLCASFLEFSKLFQQFLGNGNTQKSFDLDADVEEIHLCLAQVITCICHLKNIMTKEQNTQKPLLFARRHFKERLLLCLNRLQNTMNRLHGNLSGHSASARSIMESNYVDTLDLLLMQLTPFTDDENADDDANEQTLKMDVRMCEKIKLYVDIILSYTLSFANVALNTDKMALSAICQKVMREFQAFALECKTNYEKGSINYSDRKLKAMALENASIQMENYVNEALLRLIFVCFLDYDKISIQRLHDSLRLTDETSLDLLIADFDINMDRTAQIGIFAVCFAPNNKLKTIVRSCMASFEALEVPLIADLRFKNAPTDADILARHYNEEVAQFKAAILQIVDLQAFARCYYALLTQQNIAELKKSDFEDLLKMGAFVEDLFKFPSNKEEIHAVGQRLKYFEDFCKMLHECRAILRCFEQVEPRRVIKRFKILQAVLRKFIETLGAQNYTEKISEFALSELSCAEGISLPHNLQASISKNLSFYKNEDSSKILYESQKLPRITVDTSQKVRQNARRKESLRRFLFRRQKNLDEHNAQLSSRQGDNCILNELNDLSMNLANAYRETKDWLNETNNTLAELHITEDIVDTI